MNISVITTHGSTLRLFTQYENRETAKSILGRTWNPNEKCWEYPLRPETMAELVKAFPGARVDPRVRVALAEIAEREALATQVRMQGWEAAEPVEPMPVRTMPFRHQVAAFNMAITLPAAALLMEQGTGKSLVATAAAGRRFLRGEIRRLLIVCPASVLPVWPLEFTAHADYPNEVLTLEGPVAKRVETLADWPPDPTQLQVAVVNYEATWRMFEALTVWRPDMIVADESQRIKTPSAQQSKAMHRLGRLARYRLILTGTPITQGPLDLFSQYKFLDPAIFGNSYYAFRARHAILGGYSGREVVAYQRLPELIRKAHSIAFRVTKKEALDLPEQVDQVLYCNLESKTVQLYRQLQRESVARLSEERVVTAANVLARLLRLSQITGGFLDGTSVSKAKLALLEETLNDLLAAGKKVVVFARFLPEIAAIRKLLERKKVGYAWITGEVKMEDRGEEVKRFQEDPDCRVFVAQIQTAGLGITLTVADTAVFYSLDYSYANLDQAKARLHRISQKNAVTYLHLLAQGTVDEKVMRVLRDKKNVADEIVDNWRNYFGKEGT